jgi:aminoglycoside 6'-N-acetyltransferase
VTNGRAGRFDIRPATEADEEAMVDLELASAIHHAAVDPKRWRVPPRDAIAAYRQRRREADPEGGALLAVAPDGQVVGMVEMLLRGFVGDPGQARIPIPSVDVGISVAPEWRGRGVGSALMHAAEGWAAEQGATRIVLDLAAANEGALRLYQRLGYETHGLLMDRELGEGGEGDETAERADASSRAPEIDANSYIKQSEAPSTLEGERVRLRPLVEADRPALVEALADPSVVAVWDTRGPQASADDLLSGDEYLVAFAIEADGEFAGSIQYSEHDDPDYKSAGIDIFMPARFQGRGLGTDAVRTLARYLIEVRGHHRLTIDPAASNARAIRTYEKVGFKPVGVMRGYERGVDGTFHDGLLMDMLADELR